MIEIAVWALAGACVGWLLAGPPVLVWYLVGVVTVDLRPIRALASSLAAVVAGWLTSNVVMPAAAPNGQAVPGAMAAMAAIAAAVLLRVAEIIVVSSREAGGVA
jgi:hypothetical protein